MINKKFKTLTAKVQQSEHNYATYIGISRIKPFKSEVDLS